MSFCPTSVKNEDLYVHIYILACTHAAQARSTKNIESACARVHTFKNCVHLCMQVRETRTRMHRSTQS